MVETIVLIAIPAIAIVVTGVVIMRNEFKTQKLQEAMFEEYKRCQLYGGDENDKLRELVIRMRPICIQGKRCTFADKLYIQKAMEELGIEVEDDRR